MNLQELNVQLKHLKQNGDFQSAQSLLREWVTTNDDKPDRWLAGVTLTTFALTEGHLEEAFSHASELAEVDPHDPYINYLTGLILRLLSNPQQAHAYLNRAIVLGNISNDPNLYTYTTELCKVYLDLDMFDECNELCFSDWNLDDPVASETAPKIIARLLILGNLYRRQELYQEAIGYVKRANRLANRLPGFCSIGILEELVSIQKLKSNSEA